jgi:hypothetical protein
MAIRFDLPSPIGEFQEDDFGNWFTYRPNRDERMALQYPHEVDVGPNGDTRHALVKKTVAYVLVDEDTVEKWSLAKHNIYITH